MHTSKIQPLPSILYEDLLRAALLEDLGRGGDLTTNAIVPPDTKTTARIVARSAGRAAGVEIAGRVFSIFDPEIEIGIEVTDGHDLTPDATVMTIHGRAPSILSAERTALNLLGRLCGIATLTRSFVQAVADTTAQVVDTRKTTPGLRALEKYAVRCGGGSNHRFGLDDAVLIKDNHVTIAGGVVPALDRARNSVGHTVKVELEVDTLEQLQQALEHGVDIVLLDNMEPSTLRRAVEMAKGRALTEASGGITLDTAAEIAATGVDLLSVGALTHSAPALDLSLEVEG